MQTINLEIASRKGAKLTDFLGGLCHFQSASSGLAAYHAAQAIKAAMLRAGTERRFEAVRRATKQFNVMVSMADNDRGIRTVRLFSAIKQIEIFL